MVGRPNYLVTKTPHPATHHEATFNCQLDSGEPTGLQRLLAPSMTFLTVTERLSTPAVRTLPINSEWRPGTSLSSRTRSSCTTSKSSKPNNTDVASCMLAASLLSIVRDSQHAEVTSSSTPRHPAQDRRAANVVPPKGYSETEAKRPRQLRISAAVTAAVRNACVEREDKMIDLDARPALISVPKPAKLLGLRRASALTDATELHAAYRADDDVEH